MKKLVVTLFFCNNLQISATVVVEHKHLLWGQANEDVTSEPPFIRVQYGEQNGSLVLSRPLFFFSKKIK